MCIFSQFERFCTTMFFSVYPIQYTLFMTLRDFMQTSIERTRWICHSRGKVEGSMSFFVITPYRVSLIGSTHPLFWGSAGSCLDKGDVFCFLVVGWGSSCRLFFCHTVLSSFFLVVVLCEVPVGSGNTCLTRLHGRLMVCLVLLVRFTVRWVT